MCAYNANLCLLFASSSGGSLRATRIGLPYLISQFPEAVDFLFQSVIVKVVRVPIHLEWTIYKQHKAVDSSRLPVLSDVEEFIHFLDSVRFEHKWRTMNNILQTQYQLHEAFNKSKVFTRVIKYLANNLGVWLRDAVDNAKNGSVDENNDLFYGSVCSLSRIFGDDEALGNVDDGKLPFFCQHVPSNMNELYSNWPLGRPRKAIFGFGGCFGVSRMQRGFDERKSYEEVLQLMLEYICTRKDAELALVGLMKDVEGIVVQKVNGRPLTCFEPEHWCCIMFPFTERMLGGTWGLGSGYHVTSTHCQPV
jgi:hypothetical protein